MKYDQIGKTYNSTRIPDQRIVDKINHYLDQPSGSLIVDIGAGTGNYTYELARFGHEVVAIEPSETMRNQAKKHDHIKWIDAVAEKLPLDDGSVDGVVCTLATHHFTDLEQSFREMARVVKSHGKIVIFTADPRIVAESCWIWGYFQEIVEESCKSQPEASAFKELFEGSTQKGSNLHRFPLPYDLKDKFFFSGWRTPELYLEEKFRAGVSSLATAPSELLQANLEYLEADLKSRKWHEKYGHILNQSEYDCGYFFLVGG